MMEEKKKRKSMKVISVFVSILAHENVFFLFVYLTQKIFLKKEEKGMLPKSRRKKKNGSERRVKMEGILLMIVTQDHIVNCVSCVIIAIVIFIIVFFRLIMIAVLVVDVKRKCVRIHGLASVHLILSGPPNLLQEILSMCIIWKRKKWKRP